MSEGLRPGYGQLLAQARAKQGMSAAEVAAKLKLTVRQVLAMETEDESRLPADVFLRGFIRNYARLLDLDPDELIIPMDAQAVVADTITVPTEGVSLSRGGLQRWVVVPVVILGLFIFFVALLYHWLRQGEEVLLPDVPERMEQSEEIGQSGTAQDLTVQPDSPSLSAPPPREEVKASAVVTPPVSSQVAQATPLVQTTAPAAPAATAPKPVLAQAEPPAAPSSAVIPATSAPRGQHTLQFNASRDAWIQVEDGNGKRFSRLIRAGDGDSFTGTAPFTLVVGEAAQVHMVYDGRHIDLTPFIGQKVARLTLE